MNAPRRWAAPPRRTRGRARAAAAVEASKWGCIASLIHSPARADNAVEAEGTITAAGPSSPPPPPPPAPERLGESAQIGAAPQKPALPPLGKRDALAPPRLGVLVPTATARVEGRPEGVFARGTSGVFERRDTTPPPPPPPASIVVAGRPGVFARNVPGADVTAAGEW